MKQNEEKVVFNRKQYIHNLTYQFYSCNSLYHGQEWLRNNIPQDAGILNIVMCEEGTWGVDHKGPFKFQEKIRELKSFNSGKSCYIKNFEGPLPRSLSNKNIYQDIDVIIDITCGLCDKKTWIKIPRGKTNLKGYCSYCGAVNNFASNFQFLLFSKKSMDLFSNKKFKIDPDWVTDNL